MKLAEDILEEFSAQQGWNRDSQVIVLCRFIDSLGETLGTDMLEWFLQEQANMENGEEE